MLKVQISDALRDDMKVIFYYLFPRVFVNVMGVACLTVMATIILFGSYATVTRDKMVLLVGLAAWACIFGLARIALSGSLTGQMKKAADLHFNQTLQGIPATEAPTPFPFRSEDQKPERVSSPIAEVAGWLTPEEISRANRHILPFLQVVVRAQDKYTLVPPSIEVESIETRRVSRPPLSSSLESDGQKDTSVDVIPIALITKGFLRNNFSATVNDEKIQLLGSRDAEALSLVLMDGLWRQVFGKQHEVLASTARRIVTADPPLPSSEVKHVLEDIRRHFIRDETRDDKEKLLEHLCQLIFHLSTENLIYGVVKDLKGHAFITVSQKWTTKRRLVGGGLHKTGRLSEKLRALLGLTPRLFFLPMLSLARAESYHLEVVIPEGLYYYKGMAAAGGKQLPSKNAFIGNRRINHLHSSSVGTSLVHEMYKEVTPGQSFESTASRKQSRDTAYFALHLRESPPGVGLTLGVGALATVALVTYMTHLEPGQTPGHAIPAILASLPAILAGWMVSRLHGEALAKMSLASAANVVWYVFNSVSAALLPAALDDGTRDISFDFLELHSDSLWVGLLAVSICANLFSITWHFLLRSIRYNARLAS